MEAKGVGLVRSVFIRVPLEIYRGPMYCGGLSSPRNWGAACLGVGPSNRCQWLSFHCNVVRKGRSCHEQTDEKNETLPFVLTAERNVAVSAVAPVPLMATECHPQGPSRPSVNWLHKLMELNARKQPCSRRHLRTFPKARASSAEKSARSCAPAEPLTHDLHCSLYASFLKN